MENLLEIVELGNPVLRQPARMIDNVRDEGLQKLIDGLIATVKHANGVGIAAPQVAQSCRLFIVASRPNPRYPHAPEMEPTVMINPKILGSSTEMIKDWEGCLSIPGIRGMVSRHQAIEVEYMDRDGRLHKQELTHFVARIFQHELDHLDGIVFLDRLTSMQDVMTEQEYQKRIITVGISKANS